MMKLSQNLLAFAVVLYVTPWLPHSKAVSKCTSRRSSFGKALQGHTFEMFKANYPSGCVIRCQNELKCQSYNYVLEEKICELNNRSKEARPEDYVTDPARIYMTIQSNRVPLGSIREVPAESCEEIKASEGEEALCKNWLKPASSAETTLVHCYLNTKVYRMIFPSLSTENYAMKENAIKEDLTAFTLCLFVKLDSDAIANGEQTVYSYATSSSPWGNGIYLALFSPTIEIDIEDEHRVFKNKIEDVKWHYICVTWDNTAGTYQLYMDGQLTGSGGGLMKGHVIRSGGTAVLGQDQDSMGGGFDTDDAFGPGQLSEVNMWNKALSESEIAAQYRDCHIPQGSIHAWSQFKDAIYGEVQVEEP